MTFKTLKPTGELSAGQNKGNTNKQINILPKIFLFNVVQIALSRKNRVPAELGFFYVWISK